MAYIGRDVDKISNVEVLDNITFDGSSSYTLQKGGSNFTPSSANTLLLSIDGVVQAGNFTVSGSTIDFGTAVAGTSTCDFVLHYGVGLITSVSDGTVTSAKIGANAVTNAKLNNDIISGATELATEPADTDEFLVSDAGTLKRIDYSLIKPTSLGWSSVYMTGDTAISGDGHISSLLSIYNTGTAGTGIVDDVTSGNIRVDKNGWYYVIFQTTSRTSTGADVWYPKIYTYNGTSQSSLAYGHVYNDTGLNSTQTISVLVDISDASTIKL